MTKCEMTGALKQRASLENARKSTGPRSSLGKAKTSTNALRHGLSAIAVNEPGRSQQIEMRAAQIAGRNGSSDILNLARRVAEAQVDLERVRMARFNLIARHYENLNFQPRKNENETRLAGVTARSIGAHLLFPSDFVQVMGAI